jgi:hypothetical protein
LGDHAIGHVGRETRRGKNLDGFGLWHTDATNSNAEKRASG